MFNDGANHGISFLIWTPPLHGCTWQFVAHLLWWYVPSSITVSEAEVYNALAALDPSNAMGMNDNSPCKNTQDLCHASLPDSTPYISLCLAQHKLPQEWKLHKTVLIYKYKNKAQVEYYGTISLLSDISKIFEHVLIDKVKQFFLKAIVTSQFSFMSNHSCIQQRILFISHIMEKWNGQWISEVVYLDNKQCIWFSSIHGATSQTT